MADNVKNFWGSYRKAVIAAGVPAKNAEWYVRWARKFSNSLQKAVKNAALKAGLNKRVTCHTLLLYFIDMLLVCG